jgi:protein SCO1/2
MNRSQHLLALFATCVLAAGACREPSPAPAPTPGANGHPPALHAHADHAPAAAHKPNEHPASHEEHHAGHEHHAGQPLPAETPLPGASMYNTTATFSDQHGRPFELASLRKRAVLATMFYASCTSVCPMLVAKLASIDRSLAPETRARTELLLVTLDPVRDSTEKLQDVAKRHAITDARWHFVRTDEDSVREIAALLGIRYSALPDGEISHSPVIALLDADGTLVTRMENATGDPAELVAAADKAAAGALR